jgi:CubicO group peptidase (beta-lactamase class C family)
MLLAILAIGTMTATAQKKGRTNPVTDRFAGLDTAFERVLKEQHAAGFAVAVVEKDQIIYSKGFGYRDYEKKLPVTSNTLFAIGSSTKAFTASLMGILEDQGKIQLNKPATSYLPNLKFYNDDMNRLITVRDLMTHRTGLPRHDLAWYLFKSGSRDSLLARVQYHQPSYGIRQQFQYNNFMYLAQGMIAEKITGKSWEQNITDDILTPLGMKRSNFSVTRMQSDSNAAIGYGLKQDSIINKTDYYPIHAMGPAGSINSSVNEMANWLITWINGGKFQGKKIIPAGYINDAMSAQMVAGPGLPGSERPNLHFSNYGLGWFLASYKGHYRVEHGGNIDGFSASVCFFPSDSIGIVVLTNQNGSSVTTAVRNLLADKLLELPYFDWNTDLVSDIRKAAKESKSAAGNITSDQKKDTKPSHAIKAYEGVYTHPGYGSMEIEAKGDSLFMYLPANAATYLKHYHYDVFEPFNIDKNGVVDTSTHSPMRFQFHLTEPGDISHLTLKLEPTLPALQFNKTVKAKAISADELKIYPGEYTLSGVTIKVYLKDGKTIVVSIPGQPDYETISVGNHQFALKGLQGYSVQFALDEQGAVKEMTFVQPNGKFTATRKK